MFEIDYKGGNALVINTKKTTLVFDPKASVNGLKDISINDAVELATEPRLMTEPSDAKLRIDSPGEFGIGDCDIKAIAARRNIDGEDQPMGSVMYTVLIGDNKVAVLGNIYEKLTDAQLEEIGVVDILIIPIGGNGLTMDAHGAAQLTKTISPKVVIPVHYADSKVKYEVPQDGLDLFEKELNIEKEVVAKYKVKPGMSYPASLTMVVVERS